MRYHGIYQGFPESRMASLSFAFRLQGILYETSAAHAGETNIAPLTA
jgi:hypothetical protein